MRRSAPAWMFMITLWVSILGAAGGSTFHSGLLKKSLRQHNPHLPLAQPRSTTTTSDTCASITMDLSKALNDALGTTVPEIFGNVNFCLCLKDVSSFVQNNIICNLAVAQKGAPAVKETMVNIVNNYPGKTACSYPSNSQPACTINNACAFTCTDGYTASGGKCTCNGYVCGGKCRSSKCTKPSRVSRRKSRAPACPSGYTLCGVADMDERNPASPTGVGNFGQRPYECLETRSNIESCGGCTVPLAINERASGRDCTAIPNATAVSCRHGECVVEQCRTGYVPNTAKSHCAPA